MLNNIISNVSSEISYINSKIPANLLGAISGGIFGRELLIKSLSLDTSEEDSKVTVGLKTAANLVIRSSSIAFSLYNPVSLPFFTAFTNPVMAAGKGYQACELYIQGKVNEDERMIDEAKKKTLEVAKHVALSVIDYCLLGLVDSFDIAAIGYTLVGTALDLTRSSEKAHDKLFDPDFDNSLIERTEERDLFNDAGPDAYHERKGEWRYLLRGRLAASSAPRPEILPTEDDDYFSEEEGPVSDSSSHVCYYNGYPASSEAESSSSSEGEESEYFDEAPRQETSRVGGGAPKGRNPKRRNQYSSSSPYIGSRELADLGISPGSATPTTNTRHIAGRSLRRNPRPSDLFTPN
ncbi:MAG: hypothetical protein KR126chlam5_01011 [Candidatus Anoxychlamydiales bacterium]|nr:hypothetical protein [Candidatus Anoxychlamydiales bacterium]